MGGAQHRGYYKYIMVKWIIEAAATTTLLGCNKRFLFSDILRLQVPQPIFEKM